MTFRVRIITSWLIRVGLLCATGCASQTGPQRPKFVQAADGLYEPTLVVESESGVFHPGLGGSQPYIVYVANNDGQLDIFARRLVDDSVRQLTNHSGDEFDPRVSPDGKHIVFVSQELDVKGDIWIMDLDGSDPRPLTERGTRDRSPAFSVDGQTVYFTRGATFGAEQVVAVDIESGRSEVIAPSGWDPTPTPDGRGVCYARWDARTDRPRIFCRTFHDGHEWAPTDGEATESSPVAVRIEGNDWLVYSRYMDDHTADGVANAWDHPGLWRVPLGDRSEAETPTAVPLTLGAPGELLPTFASDWFAFTETGETGLRIAALPIGGSVPTGRSTSELFEQARQQSDADRSRFMLRYVIATDPDRASEAEYVLARQDSLQGRLISAESAFSRISQREGTSAVGVLARIELLRSQTVLTRAFEPMVVTSEDANKARAMLSQVIPEQIDVTAEHRKRLYDAELDFLSGTPANALSSLRTLLRTEQLGPETGAWTAYRMIQIYDTIGAYAQSEAALLSMAKAYPDERALLRHALDVVLNRLEVSNSEHGTRAALQRLASRTQSREIRLGCAFRRALLLERNGNFRAALSAWSDLVAGSVKPSPGHRRALKAAAEAAFETRNDGVTSTMLEDLVATYPASAESQWAKRALSKNYLAQARRFSTQRKWKAALLAYRRVLKRDPGLVVAHRGYIAAAHQAAALLEAQVFYQSLFLRHPLNPAVRYAQGLLQTYTEPSPYKRAVRSLERLLESHPRMAAAHLTLGWIWQMREHREPGKGWLEKALSSFDTALELARAGANDELVAGAQMNRAHALFELGKFDSAFASYLERTLFEVPFADAKQAWIFDMRLARAAMARNALDVALDSAKQAHRRAADDGRTRDVTRSRALVAALLAQAGMHRQAIVWFEKALNGLPEPSAGRVKVPLQRMLALSLEAVGEDARALEIWVRIRSRVSAGEGPEPYDLPWPLTELPADPTDVTRAVHGFSSAQEEQIAREHVASILSYEERFATSESDDHRQDALWRLASNDAVLGIRIKPELVRAFHRLARRAVSRGEYQKAVDLWVEALELALQSEAWTEGWVACHVIQQTQLRIEPFRDDRIEEAIKMFASRAYEEVTNVEDRQKLALTLALSWYRDHLRMPSTGMPSEGLFSGLNAAAEKLVVACDYARLAQDDLLQRDMGCAQRRPSFQERRSRGWRDLLITRTGEVSSDWRDVVQRFNEEERDPIRLPERRPFHDKMVESLRNANDASALYQFTEHFRLLELVPSWDWLSEAWQERVEAWYEEDAAQSSRLVDPRVLALVTEPVALARVQEVLSPADSLAIWLGANAWLSLTKDGLGSVLEDPCQLLASESSDDRRVFATFPLWGATPACGGGQQIHWTPSVTHWLAAEQYDVFSPEGGVSLAEESDRSVARQWRILGAGVHREAAVVSRLGDTQLRLAEGAQALDLRDLYRSRVPTRIALVARDDLSLSQLMMLSQAFLFSGTPTLGVVPDHPALHALHQSLLAADDILERASILEAALTHVIGRAPEPDGELDRMIRHYIALDKASRAIASRLKEKSAKPQDGDVSVFRSLFRLFDVMARPEIRASLKKASSKLGRRLGARLPDFRLLKERSFARVLHATEEFEESNDLMLGVADQLGTKGLKDPAAALYWELGNAKRAQGDVAGARIAFERCSALSADKSSTRKVRCLYAGAAANRALNAFENAAEEYEAGIKLARLKEASLVVPGLRFLGFLYESSLNDYARALSYFEEARREAAEDAELCTKIDLDIARVYRQLGDYERALRYADMSQAITPNLQATVLLEQAKIQWFQGYYDAALSRQSAALRFAREAEDAFLVIQALSLEGLIHRNRGHLERALPVLEDALRLAETTSRSQEVAIQLNNVGIVRREMGALQHSERALRRALEIDTQASREEGEAFDLRNLARTHIEMKKFEEAKGELTRSELLSRKIGNRFNLAETLYAQGLVALAEEDGSVADAKFDEVFRLAEEVRLPEIAWKALYHRGAIAAERAASAEARSFFERSLDVARSLPRAQERSLSGVSRSDLVASLIEVLAATEQFAEAFALLVSEVEFQVHADMKHHEVASGVDFIALSPLRLGQMREELGAEQAWWVTWSGPKRVYVGWATQAAVRVVGVDAPRSEVERVFEDLAWQMGTLSEVGPTLATLSRWMIEPVATELSGVDALIVQADRLFRRAPIWSLPFKSKVLLDTHHVRHALIRTDGQKSWARSRAWWRPQTVNSVQKDGYALLEVALSRRERWGVPAPSGGATYYWAGHRDQWQVPEEFKVRVPEQITLNMCSDNEPSRVIDFDEAEMFAFRGSGLVVAHRGLIGDFAAALFMKHFGRAAARAPTSQAMQAALRQVRSRLPHPGHWGGYRAFQPLPN